MMAANHPGAAETVPLGAYRRHNFHWLVSGGSESNPSRKDLNIGIWLPFLNEWGMIGSPPVSPAQMWRQGWRYWRPVEFPVGLSDDPKPEPETPKGAQAMAREWKPGDRAMVVLQKISTMPDRWRVEAAESDGSYDLIHLSGLHPLPASDPHAALRDEVVTAAMEWQFDPTFPNAKPLYRAASALRAAQQPPDPVAELVEAAKEWIEKAQSAFDGRLRAAVAAVEGARGKEQKP